MFLFLHAVAMMLSLLMGTPGGSGFSHLSGGSSSVTPADGGGGSGAAGGQQGGDGGGTMPG